MHIELNEESVKELIKYFGIFVVWIAGHFHTIATLKKQVNGLGKNVRAMALDVSYIKGHVGIQMQSIPELEIKKQELPQ